MSINETETHKPIFTAVNELMRGTGEGESVAVREHFEKPQSVLLSTHTDSKVTLGMVPKNN